MSALLPSAQLKAVGKCQLIAITTWIMVIFISIIMLYLHICNHLSEVLGTKVLHWFKMGSCNL